MNYQIYGGRDSIAKRHEQDMQRMRKVPISQLITPEILGPLEDIQCMGKECYCYGMHGCENRRKCDAIF